MATYGRRENTGPKKLLMYEDPIQTKSQEIENEEQRQISNIEEQTKQKKPSNSEKKAHATNKSTLLSLETSSTRKIENNSRTQITVDIRPEVSSLIKIFEKKVALDLTEELQPAIDKILENQNQFFSKKNKTHYSADAIRLLLALGITLVNEL